MSRLQLLVDSIQKKVLLGQKMMMKQIFDKHWWIVFCADLWGMLMYDDFPLYRNYSDLQSCQVNVTSFAVIVGWLANWQFCSSDFN